jgi:hypothetical protein
MMFGAAEGNDALLVQLALQLEEAAPWRSLDDSTSPAV